MAVAVSYALVCVWLAWAWWGGDGLVVCPSRLVYRLPCPGCGVTRATLLMLRGRPLDAILLNPNSLLAVGFVALYPVVALAGLWRGRPYVYRVYAWACGWLGHRRVLLAVLLFEAAVWLHNVLAGI